MGNANRKTEQKYGTTVQRHDTPLAELADAARECGRLCDAVADAIENPKEGDFQRVREALKQTLAESMDAVERCFESYVLTNGQQKLEC